MFSNLRQNQSIFIIDLTNDPTMREGVVVNIVQQPTNTYQPLGVPNSLPIDIQVKYDDGTVADFPKLQPMLTTATYNGGKVIVCDSRETASQEVENLHNHSQKEIDNIPYHQKMVAKTDEWMQALNPRYKKEKETDNEIQEIKKEVGGVKQEIQNLTGMFRDFLSSNTSSSGRSKSNS